MLSWRILSRKSLDSAAQHGAHILVWAAYMYPMVSLKNISRTRSKLSDLIFVAELVLESPRSSSLDYVDCIISSRLMWEEPTFLVASAHEFGVGHQTLLMCPEPPRVAEVIRKLTTDKTPEIKRRLSVFYLQGRAVDMRQRDPSVIYR